MYMASFRVEFDPKKSDESLQTYTGVVIKVVLHLGLNIKQPFFNNAFNSVSDFNNLLFDPL